jgi:hypothetical protein
MALLPLKLGSARLSAIHCYLIESGNCNAHVAIHACQSNLTSKGIHHNGVLYSHSVNGDKPSCRCCTSSFIAAAMLPNPAKPRMKLTGAAAQDIAKKHSTIGKAALWQCHHGNATATAKSIIAAQAHHIASSTQRLRRLWNLSTPACSMIDFEAASADLAHCHGCSV